MRNRRVLAMMAFGGAVLTAEAALASVQFVSLTAGSASIAEAWNGIRPAPVDNSNVTNRNTRDLATALSGLTASRTINAISGTGAKQAVATATETTSAQLMTGSVAELDFTGSTSLTFAPDVGGQAYGWAGDNESYAGYQFRLTTPGIVSVSFTAQGSNPLVDAYNVEIWNAWTGRVFANYLVPSSVAGSAGTSLFALNPANYIVSVFEQPADPANQYFSPDFVEGTVNTVGSASAQFTITVPEAPTWMMAIAGFAALGALSAMPKRRASVGGAAKNV